MSKKIIKHDSLRAKIRIFILLTCLGVAAILALGVSLFLFKIEDVIFCDGVIVPDKTFEIIGHLDAHVTKFHHRVGDDVKQGEVIAELDSRAYESDALRLKSAVRELEAELRVKKAELAILLTEPLPKELWFSRTNLKECEEKVRITRERLERSKKLQLVSAISKMEFEKIVMDAIQREAELERARENLHRVDSGLGQQYVDKARRDIELVNAKLQGKKAGLEFIRQRIEECRIVAPATGRIVRLACKDTWYVARGKPAAVIAAGKRIRAIARIDARVVRKVKPGQKVRVTSDVYNKYQYGNFKGRVTWIGDVPLPATAAEPAVRYPVEVELDPEGYVLKYGSGVEISIITGKQPAVYALLNMSSEDFKKIRRQRAARSAALQNDKIHLERFIKQHK